MKSLPNPFMATPLPASPFMDSAVTPAGLPADTAVASAALTPRLNATAGRFVLDEVAFYTELKETLLLLRGARR